MLRKTFRPLTLMVSLFMTASVSASDQELEELKKEILKRNGKIRLLDSRLKKLERQQDSDDKEKISKDLQFESSQKKLSKSLSQVKALNKRLMEIEDQQLQAPAGKTGRSNQALERQFKITKAGIEVLKKRILTLEKELKAEKTSSRNREKLLLKQFKVANEATTDLGETEFVVFDEYGDRSTVDSFDSRLNIGGFLNTAFTYIETEDGSESAFNRLVAELLIRAELNADWSAFLAQAFIRESDVNFVDPELLLGPSFNIVNKTPLVIAWANYQKSDIFNFRVGRFITPQGIINIEHFPATLLDIEQPQFLRPFGGDTIFPNFLNGVMLHGNTYIGSEKNNKLQYSVYSGHFTNNSNAYASGARVDYTLGDSGVTIGLNLNQGTRATPLLNEYSAQGIDLLVDTGKFFWKTEYFTTSEDAGLDREAYYTQPAIRISPEWMVFYRYDFLSNSPLGATQNRDRTESMLGINYTPYSNVRLRATVTKREFSSIPGFAESEADIVQFSGTFSF